MTRAKTAPLFTGTRSIVYVEVPNRDKPTYVAREVRLGPLSGSYYPVLHGLREGEQVVVHGAFVLDSDLQIRGGRSMMAMPDDMERAQSAPIEIDASFREGLIPVYQSYLALQEALSLDNLEEAKQRYVELAQRSATFELQGSRRARDEAKRLTTQLTAAAKGGVDVADLKAARRVFERVSLPMIDALRRYGNPLQEPLRVAECPMAIDKRPAPWVQRADEVQNPYRGSDMYRCGSIEETVEGGGQLETQGAPPPPSSPGAHQHE